MIPVRQTTFVATHPKGRGNCQAACIASILELPLEEVIDTASDECWGDDKGSMWWQNIHRWLKDAGYNTLFVEHGDERLVGQYSIGSGPSPRGNFHHAVVCKDGEMVFDPHFSDLGVTELQLHELLIPMTEDEKLEWGQRKLVALTQ